MKLANLAGSVAMARDVTTGQASARPRSASVLAVTADHWTVPGE